MSHVEEQVNVARTPVLVAEAVNLHAHLRAVAVSREALDEKASERVNRMLGSVNDLIRERAQVGHRRALAPDGFE